MPAQRVPFALFALALALLVSLAGPSVAQDQEPASQPTTEPSADAPTNTAGEPHLETLPATTVALLPVQGSYDQHAQKIAELMQHVGPPGMARGAPFGVYYNDPHAVPEAELRWAVGIPVAAEAAFDAPLEVHTVAERQVATLICTGPYETTAACYPPLFAWISEQGLLPVGPAEEHWTSDPESTSPEAIQSMILVPVAAP